MTDRAHLYENANGPAVLMDWRHIKSSTLLILPRTNIGFWIFSHRIGVATAELEFDLDDL